jgi:hypothetical protein
MVIIMGAPSGAGLIPSIAPKREFSANAGKAGRIFQYYQCIDGMMTVLVDLAEAAGGPGFSPGKREILQGLARVNP